MNRERSSRRWYTVVGVLALVGLLAAGAWLWLRPDDGSSGVPRSASAVDTAAAGASAADSALDLPELGASDEFLRRVAEGLSSRPGWASWLATDELVRRFVRVVASVAGGSSPRGQLEFMAPDGPFRTRDVDPSGGGDAATAGERTVIDRASYRRYDRPTAIFASLDTRGTAQLYRQLLPLFDEAYRELGFPASSSFEVAMTHAVETLLAVPVPEGPIAVEPDGAEAWRFADPELEALSPAQKHLLRMGPENARRVQAKLRELGRAMELPTPAVQGG